MALNQTHFQQRFEDLPDDIIALLVSTETPEKVKKLGTFAELNSEQLDQLEQDTIATLFGDSHIDDFPYILQMNLNIEPEAAENLARKIVDDVFEDCITEIKSVSDKFEDFGINTSEESISTPIEHPLPTPIAGQSAHDVPHVDHPTQPILIKKIDPAISDTKLTQPTSMPQEDIQIKGYKGIDPYREPTE